MVAIPLKPVMYVYISVTKVVLTLQRRHDEPDGVSNDGRLYCLLNRLFKRRSNKISKLRVTGLCIISPIIFDHGLTLIPAWISNYIHYKVWDAITHPFLNFYGATVEVWEWTSNFILFPRNHYLTRDDPVHAHTRHQTTEK